MSVLLALLLVQAAPAAPAAAPAPAAATDPARAALALELAEVLNSEALTRAQLTKMTQDTLPKVFAQNPSMVAIEKDHPGAAAAVIAAISPVMIDYTVRSLPDMWRAIAPVYARRLDADELRTLLAFYRGPTGRRVIDIMGRGADYGATLSRMMNDRSNTVTTSDLTGGAAPGISDVIRSASEDDRKAMVALMQTSAGRKLPDTTREVMAVVAAYSSRPDPALEKRIETLTVDTLTKHMKKR